MSTERRMQRRQRKSARKDCSWYNLTEMSQGWKDVADGTGLETGYA